MNLASLYVLPNSEAYYVNERPYYVNALLLWIAAHIAAYNIEAYSSDLNSLLIYAPACLLCVKANMPVQIRAALAVGLVHGLCHILIPFIDKTKPLGVDQDQNPGWDLLIHLGMGGFAYSLLHKKMAQLGHGTIFVGTCAQSLRATRSPRPWALQCS